VDQHILSTHVVNTYYQHMLSTHIINTCCQLTLSTHYQHIMKELAVVGSTG